VPKGGAFDVRSHKFANRLVGNTPSAATLELLRTTTTFIADANTFVSLTGAPMSLKINGREIEMYRPCRVAAGDEIQLRPTTFGMRSYLAFQGGIAGDTLFGSVCYDELSKLGTKPLSAGEQFSSQEFPTNEAIVDHFPAQGINSSDELDIEIDLAPRSNFFSDTSAIFEASFEVTSEINRVGLRLTGHAFSWDTSRRLPSEGVVYGSIQIPANGLPIIFGPDHPTTAGYPVIAVVTDSAMDLLAQAQPGTKIRFRKAR
jgi:biotin-dependent carboxylase-like uncharacterized protein